MAAPNTCIICGKTNQDESVEHIVPRMLGNLHYVLPRGVVCAGCNNRFGLIEKRVLSSVPYLDERRRLGLVRPSNDENGNSLNPDDHRKFLLKMAYESLYHSRRKIWIGSDFSGLLGYVQKGQKADLFDRPVPSDLRYNSIPRWLDRFRLSNNRIKLEYATRGNALYFRFQFGRLESQLTIVNL